MLLKINQLTPEYRDYVWGGDWLRPGMAPTAEAWVVDENNKVSSPPYSGFTLGELAAMHGATLLGRRVLARTGLRFPLLIKLLDCEQWLSLQVHPDDAQAAQLEGPGQFGKTEAWHVLEAEPGARLIAGLKTGTSQAMMEAAIRSGSILDLARYQEVRGGDTVFMPAGTIHALGPGLLIYEVQQASDLTYRIYDWGRPQTSGRVLHIEKSLKVANPSAVPQVVPIPALADGSRAILCQARYFTLELLSAQSKAISLDTYGETFHALTVIEGSATLQTGGEALRLDRFQTALISAECGEYHVTPAGGCRLLKASVEEY